MVSRNDYPASFADVWRARVAMNNQQMRACLVAPRNQPFRLKATRRPPADEAGVLPAAPLSGIPDISQAVTGRVNAITGVCHASRRAGTDSCWRRLGDSI